MAGVLIFDTLPGLFLGIAISLLLLVYRASRPHIAVLGRVPGTADQWVDVERHPQDEPVPGVAVLRVESGLFFANAEHVRATIRQHVDDDTRAVVIDAETMPFVDVSAARMLEELAEDLRRDGVALVIARDIGQVRDVLRRAGADAPLVQVHRTIEDAVDAASEPRSGRGTDAPPRRRAFDAGLGRVDHRRSGEHVLQAAPAVVDEDEQVAGEERDRREDHADEA
jgi:sulfate permease, SulP family